MCKEAECLVPIVSCRPVQVVLVGDHRQLRPVILDSTAQSFGLDQSLFERYASQAHMLTTQYRMVRLSLSCTLGGTGFSGLTRGLATLPPRWIQEPSVARDRDGRPPRGPSDSALLLCV